MIKKLMNCLYRKDVSVFIGFTVAAIFMLVPNIDESLMKIVFTVGSGFGWPYMMGLILSSIIMIDVFFTKRVFSSQLWAKASPVMKKVTEKGIYFLYGMVLFSMIAYFVTSSWYAIGISLYLSVICGMFHFYLWSFKGFDDLVHKFHGEII